MKKYYLAYGSNLNVRQMQWRCPTARIVGTAVIKDYELLFKGSKTGSYLTIEPKPGAEVPVAVWEIGESDEKALDRYEGYPDFYYKKEMDITVKDIRSGKEYQRHAFGYIMHEERPLGVPTTFYVRTCVEGYRYFKFDDRLLNAAYIKSAKGVSK